MSTPTPVRVIVDDRVRLLSAVLSVTNFPQAAQDRKRHHAHAHARATTKYVHERGLTQHPAVVQLQQLLDQGAPLEALYTLVLALEWPGLQVSDLPRWAPEGWNEQLWAFYEAAELASWWQQTHQAWDSAESQSRNAMHDVNFREFLEPFVAEFQDEMLFIPNLCYPADQEVGVRVRNQLISIVPPPLAWGESPPWPFDEETMRAQHTYRAALGQYARLLMTNYLRQHPDAVAEVADQELPISDALRAQHPTWEEQFVALFVAAAVAIYLEDNVSPAEARGFMVMEKKVHNMDALPAVVNVLRRYLQERGNRYNTMAEFLSVFPKQVRVAKRIISL